MSSEREREREREREVEKPDCTKRTITGDVVLTPKNRNESKKTIQNIRCYAMIHDFKSFFHRC